MQDSCVLLLPVVWNDDVSIIRLCSCMTRFSAVLQLQLSLCKLDVKWNTEVSITKCWCCHMHWYLLFTKSKKSVCNADSAISLPGLFLSMANTINMSDFFQLKIKIFSCRNEQRCQTNAINHFVSGWFLRAKSWRSTLKFPCPLPMPQPVLHHYWCKSVQYFCVVMLIDEKNKPVACTNKSICAPMQVRQ